jgi:hypothetical protein
MSKDSTAFMNHLYQHYSLVCIGLLVVELLDKLNTNLTMANVVDTVDTLCTIFANTVVF